MPKKHYTLTKEEFQVILDLNKNKMPVIKIGEVWTGMDLQEKLNRYWEELGNKYGFEPFSVEGCPGEDQLHFLATPKVTENVENIH